MVDATAKHLTVSVEIIDFRAILPCVEATFNDQYSEFVLHKLGGQRKASQTTSSDHVVISLVLHFTGVIGDTRMDGVFIGVAGGVVVQANALVGVHFLDVQEDVAVVVMACCKGAWKCSASTPETSRT